MWDKRLSPTPMATSSPTRRKQGSVHTQVPLCPECDDSEMFEDLTNRQMVCRECGLTERLLLSDDVKWCDMDWKCTSIT